jgi:zinc protease
VDDVSIHALFKGGNRHETEETNGLFTILSQLLTKGTKRHTAAQIVELVEARGGSIESGSGKETFWVRLNVLAKDLDFGMELLGELLTQSTFPEDELEKQKKDALARLQNQENDWQSEAITFFLATCFADHPYHLNGIGSTEAISATTRDAVVAAHRAYTRAGSAVVAVCGGVAAADVERAAGRFLRDLPAGSCPDPVSVSLPRRTGVERATKVNDKGQVTICMGYPGPSFGHGDEYPIRLMDAITSGINLPQGWLQDALRGRNDLVYFVHLMPILYQEAGVVVILTQCQPDLVDTVMTLLAGEMQRARAGEFTEEDIEAAKGEYITAVDNDTQTSAVQAHRLASYELLGVGRDAAFSFADRVRSVKVSDVQRVSAEYLTGSVVTLAGPLAEESSPAVGDQP